MDNGRWWEYKFAANLCSLVIWGLGWAGGGLALGQGCWQRVDHGQAAIATAAAAPPSSGGQMSPSSYKKPSPAELKARLTPEQYRCTQEEGTERPFANPYWDHKEEGIYVDVVSGEPLFASIHKFDSGTGWPSFTTYLGDHVVERQDHKLLVPRIEVRSKDGDSHLGHVFHDGPAPTGLRYCINSAALRFVPLAELGQAGLSHLLFVFAEAKGWDIATLAGGCFWGMEELLRKLPGVITSQVGYTGDDQVVASYPVVSRGNTQHAESVQILFDPKQLTYTQLLAYFFRIHDPTTANQQGNDKGKQYRSAIFYRNKAQAQQAQALVERLTAAKVWPKPITTQLAPLGHFYRAEEEHQLYLMHHPNGYTCHYERPLALPVVE